MLYKEPPRLNQNHFLYQDLFTIFELTIKYLENMNVDEFRRALDIKLMKDKVKGNNFLYKEFLMSTVNPYCKL
jgi:hypothetical protein